MRIIRAVMVNTVVVLGAFVVALMMVLTSRGHKPAHRRRGRQAAAVRPHGVAAR